MSSPGKPATSPVKPTGMAQKDLPTLLRQARELMPDRVKFVGSHIAQVMYMGSRRAISWDEPESLVWLEMACREEIVARRWTCELTFQRNVASAVLWRGPFLIGDWTRALAPTDAHAILAVLVEALEANA